MTMAFVNGKKDGTGQNFNVTVGSKTRQTSAFPAKSAPTDADKVCNIYDLEGNFCERVAELANTVSGTETITRGGRSDDPSTLFSASYRGSLKSYISFRMVLYVINN